MHVTVDLCRKTRYQHQILITLCIISFFVYAANKYWYFAPNLTPMGLMRNLPYYYMGYVMGQHGLFRTTHMKRDLTGCILCLGASILLFAWHLDAFFGGIRMDLRNAAITEDEEIEIHTFFGGIELFVPQTVNVLVKSRSFIGGVGNHASRTAEKDAHCLHIIADNFIGGVDIKN